MKLTFDKSARNDPSNKDNPLEDFRAEWSNWPGLTLEQHRQYRRVRIGVILKDEVAI